MPRGRTQAHDFSAAYESNTSDNFDLNGDKYFSHSNKHKRKPTAPQRLGIVEEKNMSKVSKNYYGNIEPINLISRGVLDSPVSSKSEHSNEQEVNKLGCVIDQTHYYSAILNYLLLKYPALFQLNSGLNGSVDNTNNKWKPNTPGTPDVPSQHMSKGKPQVFNYDCYFDMCARSHPNWSRSFEESPQENLPLTSTCHGTENRSSHEKHQIEWDPKCRTVLINALETCIHNVPAPRPGLSNYEALLFCYKNVVEKAYVLQNSLEIYFSLLTNAHTASFQCSSLLNEFGSHNTTISSISRPPLSSTSFIKPDPNSLIQTPPTINGNPEISLSFTNTKLTNGIWDVNNHLACNDEMSKNLPGDGFDKPDSSANFPVDLTKQNLGMCSSTNTKDDQEKEHRNCHQHSLDSDKSPITFTQAEREENKPDELTKCLGLNLSTREEKCNTYAHLKKDVHNVNGTKLFTPVSFNNNLWSFSSKSLLKQRKQCYFKAKRMKKAIGLSSTVCGNSEHSDGLHHKKSNFRGTSEEENRVAPDFKPMEVNGQIILSESHPNVKLSKDIFCSLIVKSSGSATRLIRLLMKSFFTQDELAASSLSGEGIYKQRLEPSVTEAIKLFIRKRHPQLKTGSINLCMTDVCVQARRVANNQRSRQHPFRLNSLPSEARSNHSSDGSVTDCSKATSTNQTSSVQCQPFVPSLKHYDDDWAKVSTPTRQGFNQELAESIWAQASRLAGLASEQTRTIMCKGEDSEQVVRAHTSSTIHSEAYENSRLSPDVHSDSSTLSDRASRL